MSKQRQLNAKVSAYSLNEKKKVQALTLVHTQQHRLAVGDKLYGRAYSYRAFSVHDTEYGQVLVCKPNRSVGLGQILSDLNNGATLNGN